MQKSRFTRCGPHLPSLLLALFISLYVVYFSWYTINRHTTLNSYAADLSLIDQPMWNTVRGPGGFMEQTWGSRQQPRLAEHVEPILVPLALLFFIWDDVRILLIAQSVALAVGALPVYWLARHHLTPPAAGQPSIYAWLALAFALAYLLFSPLQAANIADFHADPFVVAPLLFAFWYASQQRWRWMWLWAIIAMLTKETLPTLTAMLGLWLIFQGRRQSKKNQPTGQPPTHPLRHPATRHGLALIIISLTWFYVATFLIVAPLARQYFGTAGPIYFSSRFTADTELWPIVTDPARWGYLLRLFGAFGFLSLLAPELLLLGLPVLAANLLSNFPGQYSGEQHYTAPLAAAWVIAAIYGCRRFSHLFSERPVNGQPLRLSVLIAATLWLLVGALSSQALHGWTPLSLRTESYTMTPAATTAPRLNALIPPSVPVSASAAIHPHLAHRRVIYLFPTVEEATYLHVDVTDIPGVHPNDAHRRLLDLLAGSWALVEADAGLILAQKTDGAGSRSAVQFPDAFFDFARAASPPDTPASVSFGEGQLRLTGYDVQDDPDDGITFRFYWQTATPLPAGLRLWPLVYDDNGRLLNDPLHVPMIATVWYPPERWQPGETVVTETLPQRLPDTFHLGLAVGPDSASLYQPEQRWPAAVSPAEAAQLQVGRWVQLASFARQGPFLVQMRPLNRLHRLMPQHAEFGPGLVLTGAWLDEAAFKPGAAWPILLQWRANRPLSQDLTVFIHLLGPDGQRLAQSDAYPTWLTPQPTSWWPDNQPIMDRHTLTLPPDLPPGRYTVQLGLYNAQTQERLALPDGRDAFELAQFNRP